MSVDYKAIGNRIKARRKAMNRTQEKLAESLEVSVGYVSQIERGVTKISMDTLSEISDFLSCDIAELVTEVTPTQSGYLSSDVQNVYNRMDERQKNLLLDIAEVIAGY